jgi:hypothetical protein
VAKSTGNLEASFVDFDKAGEAGIREAIKGNTKVSSVAPYPMRLILTSWPTDYLDRIANKPNVDPSANNLDT